MTLRARLAVGLVFMGLVMTVGGFAVVRTIADSQRRQLDALISDTLPDVARVVPASGPATSRGVIVFGKLYVARIDPDGSRRVVADPATGSKPQIPADAVGTWVPATDEGLPGSTYGEIVDAGSVDGGSERWRAVVLDDRTSGARLLVAVSQADTDDTNRRLIWASFAVAVAGLGAFFLAGWWGVLFGLRPISDVAATARAIVSGDRTRRVEIDDPRTEAGQLAEVFNLMVDENERIERRLRRFIADASHELRTPLTTIRGFAELYRQGAARAPEQTADLLRRIEDEAARMGLLVEDLLLLARMDRERPIALAPVELPVLASDAVEAARVVAPDRRIELERDPGAGPLVVLGDDARLRQVIGNLMTNALTHTPPDASVTLRLRAEAGNLAVVEVADTGPGLTPEQAERVFERFYRVDAARTRRAGGPISTGLGLAIVAALVAAHHGTVEVDKTPGGGATFRVKLPLLPEAPEPGE